MTKYKYSPKVDSVFYHITLRIREGHLFEIPFRILFTFLYDGPERGKLHLRWLLGLRCASILPFHSSVASRKAVNELPSLKKEPMSHSVDVESNIAQPMLDWCEVHRNSSDDTPHGASRNNPPCPWRIVSHKLFHVVDVERSGWVGGEGSHRVCLTSAFSVCQGA